MYAAIPTFQGTLCDFRFSSLIFSTLSLAQQYSFLTRLLLNKLNC